MTETQPNTSRGLGGKLIPPAIDQRAFNCPHCEVLAKQSWFEVYLSPIEKDKCPKVQSAEPKIAGSGSFNNAPWVPNLFISQCFNCDRLSVWIGTRLSWPLRGQMPLPNADLSDDVRRDYLEAGAILDLSPRGAAAMLRLAVQKLCKELGQPGENINSDIAALVKTGLPVLVQQSLDVVRVVGNNAVHPGLIDLRDDRATAEELFMLINLIAEIMISTPKHVQEAFDRLPERDRMAIERRDRT